MSQKIADALGVDYCGVQYNREGKAACALYNDTHVCGGQFAVDPIHDVLDVANALVAKRKEFEACRV